MRAFRLLRCKPASSSIADLPRLLGACVVTPPCVYYLLPSESHAEHHGGHEEHAEAHEEKEEEKEAPQEEQAPAEESQPEPEPEQAPQQEEKKDEPQATDTTEEQEKAKESEETAKPSGTEGDSQPMSNDANKISSKTEEGTSEQKDQPESRGNKENVSFKGKMKEDAEGQSDNRKREPDSKGAYKKRIDSGLGKDLGASDNPASDDESQQVDAVSVVFGVFLLSAFDLLVPLSRSVSIYRRSQNGILIRTHRPLPRSKQTRAPVTCLASSSASRPPPPATRPRLTRTRPSPRSRKARKPPSRWALLTRTDLRCKCLFDAAQKALDLSVNFCRKRSEREIVVGVHIVHVKLGPSSVSPSL